MIDIAVIGAGMAGLTCAQQLRRAGYSVVVLEKSRGLGGRVATRRLTGTCADHGARYLEVQGPRSHQLIQVLSDRHLFKPWSAPVMAQRANEEPYPLSVSYPRYVAPAGMTAAAKFLGTGLDIRRGQRVKEISPTSTPTWELTLEPLEGHNSQTLSAQAVVLTIPAPQALDLLVPLESQGLSAELLQQVQSVEFDPCLTAIATYAPARMPSLEGLPWGAVQFFEHPTLAWVGLESCKRPDAEQPVFVVQSSSQFAAEQFEAPHLMAVGRSLMAAAADLLLPWLEFPEVLQVHRWRYALARSPLPVTALQASVPLPLVCGGDWCGGSNIESALTSGFACAEAMNGLLGDRPMPALDFFDLAQPGQTADLIS